MQDTDLYRELVIKAEEKAETVIQKLKELSFTIAMAESCTAGLVTALLANISGASAVLWGSYVCYTQDAKMSMLGLDSGGISVHGSVSEETAYKMAKAALEKSGADIAVSVTGLAGPDGDGSIVPVGTVWIATGLKNEGIETKKFFFKGSRNDVRFLAAIAALEMVLETLT